jgi:6-phosphofructokinase 1
MNAAIRAVVRRALAKGVQVKGIYKGYDGLINEEIFDIYRFTLCGDSGKGSRAHIVGALGGRK